MENILNEEKGYDQHRKLELNLPEKKNNEEWWTQSFVSIFLRITGQEHWREKNGETSHP